MVVCHGYQSSQSHPTIDAITKGLIDRGHATFTFNFSDNAGGIDIEHQVADISHVIEYFSEYEEVILLAASFGALSASIATIRNSKVNRLITLNGFFGSSELGQEFRRKYIGLRALSLIYPKYRKIHKYFRRELKPDLVATPVLVIHSKTDESVDIEQSKRFYAALTCPKNFVVLKSANHGITNAIDQALVVQEIDTWLSRDESTR